jgi:hypothetical protein
MPTFKTTQMTNFTAGPPATTLKSSEHNRVHCQYGSYTTTGAETLADDIYIALIPVDAKILATSYISWEAMASGTYFAVGDAGDETRFKTWTDCSSAGSLVLDTIGNLDWEVDSTANQTVMISVSGTLAADKDIHSFIFYVY